MKTLHDYLKTQLARADPYPAIDHSIRAEMHEDGRISFYIHAQGRDSETFDFWVKPDGSLVEKRLSDEPMPETYRQKVLDAVRPFSGSWAIGDKNCIIIPLPEDYKTPSRVPEITAAIQSVEGVTAKYCGTDGDDYYVFRPHLG